MTSLTLTHGSTLRSLNDLPSPTTNEARIASIFNSAGTVIRHHLPMVSKVRMGERIEAGLHQCF